MNDVDSCKIKGSFKRSQELCMLCLILSHWNDFEGNWLMVFEYFRLKHWAWNQYHVMDMNHLQMKKSYWLGTNISQSSWLLEMFAHIFNVEFQMYVQFALFGS